MIRLALVTLAVHFLAPLVYAVLFEQYNGDDIIWHPRNVIVHTFATGAMVLCPLTMTGILYFARRRNTSEQTEIFFALWAVDMMYTFLIFLLQPAVH